MRKKKTQVSGLRSQVSPPGGRFPRAERVHAYARAVVAGEIVAGRYVRAACQRHLDDLASGHQRGLVWMAGRASGAIQFFEETLCLDAGVPFKLEDFQAFIVGSLLGWWRVDVDMPGFETIVAASAERGEPAVSEPGTYTGGRARRNGASATGKDWASTLHRLTLGEEVPAAQRPPIVRRFRQFYGEMGKGNGKTPLAAGLGLLFLTMGYDRAPEVYSAAAAKEQARICFDDALLMVKSSPELAKRLTILTHSITHAEKHGRFLVLSSEDRGQHGKRVSYASLDEIHAHATAAMVKAMIAGTKNCKNALIALITNSGHDRRSICRSYHDRSVGMLRGKPDDSLFAYVCTLDPCPACLARGKEQPDPKCKRCDDWRDRKVWKKANPGLGTICRAGYVAERVEQAQSQVSVLNDVLQLNFCLWTESSNGWADMHAWRNRCHEPALTLDQFIGQECTIGLDAANRVDATCLVLCFERQPGSGTLDPETLGKSVQAVLAESAGSVEQGAGSEDPGPQPGAIRALAASGYAIFLLTYIPESMVNNTTAANYEAYQLWRSTGPGGSVKNSQPSTLNSQLSARWPTWLTVTPGASTDFGAIEADILFINQHWPIRRLQADPRELGYLLQRVTPELGEQVVVQVSQGPTMISQPMKEFEGLIASGLIRHNGNPVLDWMLGNVEQKTTSRGGPVKYYYPTRPTESQKIDAVPAALMALDGALRAPATVAVDPGMVVLG